MLAAHFRARVPAHDPAHEKRGIALLLVVSVLAVLTILAIPFALSMSRQERIAKNTSARLEARIACRTALAHARGVLSATHEPLDSSPLVDGLGELDLSIEKPLAAWLELDAAGGTDASARATDASGLVNVNSASIWLWGNLLGSTAITTNLPVDEDEIEVESTAGFAKSGVLWVNGERIEYGDTDPTHFLDCRRERAASTGEFRPALLHLASTLVVPFEAYLLATHPIRLRDRAEPFAALEDIRRIGEAGRGALTTVAFERIRDLLTAHSPHLATGDWISAGRLRRDLPGSSDPTDPDWLAVDEPRFLAPGAIVRIRQGNRCDHLMVAFDPGGRPTLNGRVQGAFDAQEARVDVLARHPVNVNTAPPQVLVALFEGLKAGSNAYVSRAQAIAAARAVLDQRDSSPFPSLAGLASTLQALDTQEFPSDRVPPVLANGQNPTGGGLAVSTAPVTFASGNVHHVFATGRVGSPAGVELARSSVRQVLRASSGFPAVSTRSNPYDFQRGVELAPAYKVAVWPYKMGLVGSAYLDPLSGEAGTVRLETGTLQPLAQGQGFVQSYPAEHEGKKLAGPSPEVPNVTAVDTGGGVTEMATGALSFWFKLLERPGGRVYLADMGTEAGSNRFSIYLDGDEVVLSVADATLEPSYAEVRAMSAVLTDTWTHVWAGYKSTMHGHLSLLVDGTAARARQVYRIGGQETGTVLSAPFSSSDIAFQVDDASGFATEGVALVGSEEVNYQRLTGNSFTVRSGPYPGFTAGSRNRVSAPANHARGEPVMPFGYRNFLAGDLVVGGALLTENYGNLVYTTANIAPVMVNGIPVVPPLAATDTQIPVQTTAGFQTSGLVLLVQMSLPNFRFEVAFYGGRGGSQFTGVERGQMGTTAQDFNNPDLNPVFVIPLSIVVDDASGYPAQGWIQIDDEWLSVVGIERGRYFVIQPINLRQIRQNAPQYLQQLQAGTITLDQIIQQNLVRAQDATIEAIHASGVPAIPVFDVQTAGLTGRGDSVTVIQGNDPASREAAVVRWAFANRVGLDSFTTKAFSAGARLLKFPSGELPNVVGPIQLGGMSPAIAAGPAGGPAPPAPASMMVDEILLQEMGRRGPFAVSAPSGVVPDDATEFDLNTTQGMDAQGGAIQVGEEIIAYQQIQQNRLLGLTRGYLDTVPRIHPDGAPMFNLSYIPVTTLAANLSSDEDTIRVNRAPGVHEEGYLRIDDELLGYVRRQNQEYRMPSAAGGGPGLFRGAFGTQKAAHPQGTPVFEHPFRYFDRYALESPSPEIASWTTAFHAPRGYWEMLSIDIEDHGLSSLEVHALVRLDGAPDWDATPGNQLTKGALLLVSPAGGDLPLGVVADTVEVRFFFYYDRGAFLDRRAWKETPWLEKVEAVVWTREAVLEHREER